MPQPFSGGQTAHGYQPPSITQFSVFMDNRCGKLLDLLQTFDGQELKLAALTVIDASDHAVIRLVSTSAELARQALGTKSFSFIETDILLVELAGHRILSNICTALLSAELNIHFAYPLMVCPHGAPTIALHCDDLHLAGQILLRKQFALLGEGDLAG